MVEHIVLFFWQVLKLQWGRNKSELPHTEVSRALLEQSRGTG